MSGKVVQTAELAVDYGFTDVNGGMPEGYFSGVEAAKLQREMIRAGDQSFLGIYPPAPSPP